MKNNPIKKIMTALFLLMVVGLSINTYADSGCDKPDILSSFIIINGDANNETTTYIDGECLDLVTVDDNDPKVELFLPYPIGWVELSETTTLFPVNIFGHYSKDGNNFLRNITVCHILPANYYQFLETELLTHIKIKRPYLKNKNVKYETGIDEVIVRIDHCYDNAPPPPPPP